MMQFPWDRGRPARSEVGSNNARFRFAMVIWSACAECAPHRHAVRDSRADARAPVAPMLAAGGDAQRFLIGEASGLS